MTLACKYDSVVVFVLSGVALCLVVFYPVFFYFGNHPVIMQFAHETSRQRTIIGKKHSFGLIEILWFVYFSRIAISILVTPILNRNFISAHSPIHLKLF